MKLKESNIFKDWVGGNEVVVSRTKYMNVAVGDYSTQLFLVKFSDDNYKLLRFFLIGGGNLNWVWKVSCDCEGNMADVLNYLMDKITD